MIAGKITEIYYICKYQGISEGGIFLPDTILEVPKDAELHFALSWDNEGDVSFNGGLMAYCAPPGLPVEYMGATLFVTVAPGSSHSGEFARVLDLTGLWTFHFFLYQYEDASKEIWLPPEQKTLFLDHETRTVNVPAGPPAWAGIVPAIASIAILGMLATVMPKMMKGIRE